MLSRLNVCLLAMFALIWTERGASCEESDKGAMPTYVRLAREEGKPVGLQTAITRFSPDEAREENGLSVDLIGAVHLGDAGYYHDLNKRFRDYDVVLYELVAAPENRIPQAAEGSNPMRMVHRMMQSTLGLASQLDEVDYSLENFKHADMSPADMARTLKARGDTPVTFALSALVDVLRKANIEAERTSEQPDGPTISQQDVFSALTGEGNADLRLLLAEQLARDGGNAMALGPTLDQLLVKDRNGVAMKVFQRELATGHKRIAIFYGAAHMPDFERRLTQDFGLVRESTEWLTAWDLTAERATESPMNVLLRMFLEP